MQLARAEGSLAIVTTEAAAGAAHGGGRRLSTADCQLSGLRPYLAVPLGAFASQQNHQNRPCAGFFVYWRYFLYLVLYCVVLCIILHTTQYNRESENDNRTANH